MLLLPVSVPYDYFITLRVYFLFFYLYAVGYCQVIVMLMLAVKTTPYSRSLFSKERRRFKGFPLVILKNGAAPFGTAP